ncbi:flagellar hook-associated protein FlgK [Radicibacter daui]|uniref:flagellar hook-associated protein FlgK n=1 Tax=Radicibacter daui TaxID=3064829 RepID=UPI004046956A
MTLSASLYTALSSLSVIQQQMSVTSSNIANADVAGYTKKTLSVSTDVQGSTTLGVTSSGITAATNSYLLKTIAAAASDSGYATTYSDYFDQLDQAMGSIDGSDSNGTSLASMLTDLSTDLANLAATPESDTLKNQVVADLEDTTATLRETSDTIQDMRTQADQEISDTVDEINSLLYQIDDLNDQINKAAANGQSTSDLEDQRTQALQDLADKIDVSYYVDSNNKMQIYTTSGVTLLGSEVRELSHTAVSSASADTTYASGGFDGITVGGVDITTSINSGSLKALIDQRDTVLPAAQDELDELASSLITTLNSIYNASTSNPPPTSLTGTTSVSATDAFSGTGTVRVAVTDSDGNVTSYADLDLSSYSTVQDVVDALNGITGVTASVDSDGNLSIASSDGTSGIAINEMDSAVGSDDEGFSSYFGLNDLLTGTSATDIAVRADIAASPGTLATGSLSDSSSLAVGDSAVGSGDGTVATALSDAFTSTQSFSAAGELGASTKTFADYAAAIVSKVATDTSNASTAATTASDTLDTLTTSYSSQFGVNTDEETARLTELQNAYSTSAQIVSTVQSMFEALLNAVAS